jgi:hypothetical protein
LQVGGPVSSAVRLAEVQGLDGRRPLGDLLRGLTLVVFLREFG